MTTRQAFPDQLRGIALLGIVLVNVPFLAIGAEGYSEASVANGWDRAVAFLVTMLAPGKFYIIFSFLFGYSSLFILKDDSKPYRSVYLRRLVALLLLGIAHAIFFFVGDILITYALLGFALLLLVKRSDRALWLTALIVWIVAACWVIGVALLTLLASLLFPEVTEVDLAMFDAYDASMTDGTFWQAAIERMKVYPIVIFGVILGQGFFAFVAFCLGMLAARYQFLGRLEEFRPWLRRCAIWGLAFGLPLQFACTWFILGPGVPVGLAAPPPSVIASAFLLVLAPAQARHPRRPRPKDLHQVHDHRNELRRHRRLHQPPPQIRRPLRHPVLRRRHHRDPPGLTRLPPGSQQPRRQLPHRDLRRRQGHRRPVRHAIRNHREQRIAAVTNNDHHVTTTTNAPPKPPAGRSQLPRHRHHP